MNFSNFGERNKTHIAREVHRVTMMQHLFATRLHRFPNPPLASLHTVICRYHVYVCLCPFPLFSVALVFLFPIEAVFYFSAPRRRPHHSFHGSWLSPYRFERQMHQWKGIFIEVYDNVLRFFCFVGLVCLEFD